MKVKKNYMLRSVAGQNVVVPIGDAALDFNGMINLNESGAFLWRHMTEDIAEKELVAALLSEYDIEPAIAEADVKAFIQKMKEAKLIDE